jgi:hypothetical protein
MRTGHAKQVLYRYNGHLSSDEGEFDAGWSPPHRPKPQGQRQTAVLKMVIAVSATWP